MQNGLLFIKHSEVNNYGRTKSTRPKSTIISSFFISLVFSNSLLAAETATNQQLFDNDAVAKLVIALIVLLISSAAIPAIKNHLNYRSKKKSYISYLQANIKSTLTHFGEEHSKDFALNLMGIKQADWVDKLSDKGVGVPKLLMTLQELFEKTEAEEGLKTKYIPYVTYAAMPITELDHDHPIWSLKESETQIISDYLLSQSNAQKSIAYLYDQPFFELAHHDIKEKHQQWVKAAFVIIDELAEHYINTQKLKKLIKKNFKLDIEVNGD